MDDAELPPLRLPPLPSGSELTIRTLPQATSPEEVCLGGKLWRAAPTLCSFLCQESLTVQGCSVIELGAGVGACGLYAAGLGAKRVAITDGDGLARQETDNDGVDHTGLLQLMEQNVEHNRALYAPDACVEAHVLNWGAAPPSEHFNWIIGSDVVWGGDHEAHAALCHTIRALLQPDDQSNPTPPRVILANEHGLPRPSAEIEGLYFDQTLEELSAAAAVEGLQVVPVPGWQGGGARCGVTFEWEAEAFGSFTGQPVSEIYLVEMLRGRM